MRDHECQPNKCSFTDKYEYNGIKSAEYKGSEVIEYIIRDITTILKMSRAKRCISEDDLDKSICWLHDMSDIV